METDTLVPQQEQSADETASALRPWTTPRLQYLSGSDSAKIKGSFPTETTLDLIGPS